MSHPMEGYYDGVRAERDRLWARRDAMEKRLSAMKLSEFTFAQFADLQLLADRRAVSERASALVDALDRLDVFLAERKKASKTRRRH